MPRQPAGRGGSVFNAHLAGSLTEQRDPVVRDNIMYSAYVQSMALLHDHAVVLAGRRWLRAARSEARTRPAFSKALASSSRKSCGMPPYRFHPEARGRS